MQVTKHYCCSFDELLFMVIRTMFSFIFLFLLSYSFSAGTGHRLCVYVFSTAQLLTALLLSRFHTVSRPASASMPLQIHPLLFSCITFALRDRLSDSLTALSIYRDLSPHPLTRSFSSKTLRHFAPQTIVFCVFAPLHLTIISNSVAFSSF